MLLQTPRKRFAVGIQHAAQPKSNNERLKQDVRSFMVKVALMQLCRSAVSKHQVPTPYLLTNAARVKDGDSDRLSSNLGVCESDYRPAIFSVF